MDLVERKDVLDRTFEIGIVLKGLNGALELIGGLLLVFVSPATINRLAISVTQQELSKDPHDFIARHIIKSAHGLTGSSVAFGAIFLLSHGVVKIALVVALLRNKLWAYPWMIAFLFTFIAYQLYRVVVRPTFWMGGLTIFDGLIVWLTFREWRKQSSLRNHGPPAFDS